MFKRSACLINISADDILKYFSFLARNFIQTVSKGDNLHDMSKPIFWKNKDEKCFKMLSADLAQGGVGRW